MKKLFIVIFLSVFMLVTIQKVNAQNKKIIQDTVYYYLDTASIPSKDRMFEFDEEVGTVSYVLLCKCYPWETDARFFYNKSDKTEAISIERFNRIQTLSITQLIDITVKYARERIDKHKFFFIEPNGKTMKVIRVYLSDPKKPQQPSQDYIIIPPSH